MENIFSFSSLMSDIVQTLKSESPMSTVGRILDDNQKLLMNTLLLHVGFTQFCRKNMTVDECTSFYVN